MNQGSHDSKENKCCESEALGQKACRSTSIGRMPALPRKAVAIIENTTEIRCGCVFELPRIHWDVPAIVWDVPAIMWDVPSIVWDVPAIAWDVPRDFV